MLIINPLDAIMEHHNVPSFDPFIKNIKVVYITIFHHGNIFTYRFFKHAVHFGCVNTPKGK